ncbi:hypothetical protein DID80_04365 [Candidatus Marinamargulisbacteria bacterium SCGC AAA071-K20]|nr:hypothetical protein DID80_04365 [Candidatus Marinamargulisbacteria bacterium SCGC AAA071-K20]
MKINPVKFGTSGHRGIIGETFKPDHIQAIAYAVSKFLGKETPSPSIVIGYDPREGNSPSLEENSFTKLLVDTLLDQGVNVYYYDTYVPTPLISKHIIQFSLQGGLILTASHNPPEYNGIKFNPKNGAPAPELITKEIESIANSVLEKELPQSKEKGSLTLLSETTWFSKELITLISNWFPETSISHSTVICDTKYGTCAPVWKTIFESLQLKNYELVNSEPRSDFGGIEPNPTNTEGLKDLMQKVTLNNASIGISNDPDGDRFSIVDDLGEQLIPEEATAIITDYLIQRGLPVTEIVTTVASSGIVKAVTSLNNLSYNETAVGFKHFAPFLETAKNKSELSFGVESSGGLTCSLHTMEKCGFLPGLCLLYIMADSKKSLSELKMACLEKYGKFSFQETSATFDNDQKETIVKTLNSAELKSLSPLFSKPISKLDKTDGLKVIFDNNDWVLIRLSGTEPLARLYSESKNETDANQYLIEAKTLFLH